MTAIRACSASWILAAVVLVSGADIDAAAAGQAGSPAQTATLASEKFEQTLSNADERFNFGDADGAYSLYRKAAAYHDGPCAECLVGMARVDFASLRLKDAIATAQKALAVPGVTPAVASGALEVTARAHQRKGQQTGDRLEFVEAEASLRRALLATPDRAALHHYLGLALLAQERDDEGVAELRAGLEAEPTGERARYATRLIADPSRGRANATFDFTGTTADGKTLDTETLRGKVVVLDFWASWCAPCRGSLPAVKQLAARMAGEPLVVISISDDRDEKTWREFISKNQMAWPQLHDRRVFWYYEATAIPTYVVVDKDGFVRARIVGGGKKRENDLRQAIDACLK